MDEFYRRKPVQSDAAMPLHPPEEEKKQSQLSETQMPHQQLEEEKQFTGHLRVQVIEETKSEVFMTAKVDDPALRREQMAIDLRKSKKQELLSKRRYPAHQDQSFIHAPEEFYEFPDEVEEQQPWLDGEVETLTVE
jgi:hypothetical protein